MPYIKKDDRLRISNEVDAGIIPDLNTPGELNYFLTLVCLSYLDAKGMSYTNASEVVSSLECAKLEFYRRKVAPYEDEKIKENGDVY